MYVKRQHEMPTAPAIYPTPLKTVLFTAIRRTSLLGTRAAEDTSHSQFSDLKLFQTYRAPPCLATKYLWPKHFAVRIEYEAGTFNIYIYNFSARDIFVRKK